MTEKLTKFQNLQYINIRMCHISQEELCALGRFKEVFKLP